MQRFRIDYSSLVPDDSGDIYLVDEADARIQELEAQVARLKKHIEAIEMSSDGYGGGTWCSDCHAPMQVVRPGKHQCVHCEDRESLRAEVAALREDQS